MPFKIRLTILCCILVGLAANYARGQELNKVLKQADSLRERGDYILSEHAYKKALERSVRGNKPDTTGLIYLRLGIVFGRRSLYEEALKNYFEALKCFEAIDSKKNIAAVKGNIGNVYRTLGKYQDAFFYVNSSYRGLAKLEDSSGIPFALHDLGMICMDQDSIEQALFFFQKILSDFKGYTNRKLDASVFTNIASVYQLKGNYSKALQYYWQAYEFRQQIGDKNKMALILCNIAIAYLNMHRYKKALEAQDRSLKLAKEIGSRQLIQLGFDNYADIYKGLGNYRKAYDAAVESMAWKDSIYRQDNTQFKSAELNYQREQEIAKREKEEIRNKLLQDESRLKSWKIEDQQKSLRQRNILVITILIITTLAILSILLLFKAFRTRQQNERILEKQQNIILQSQLIESELTALRAQMNPHFIFNALSSIKNYMLEQNMQQADYYLGKFAKLIRLILDNSSQNFVSLEKEIQLLQSYIQLEQLRFEDKFSYQISIDKEINTMEIFIPSMIIQPFVENSIIHGFLHKEGKCFLEIGIKHFGTYLMVIVKDNGVGRLYAERSKNASAYTSHQSKGYKISEERLKVLSRNSNANAGISFKDLADSTGKTGTLVEINIPLHLNINEQYERPLTV